ncbi:MAG: DJ-1/PfpI family protein [Thermoleophilia bacterium]
MKLRGRTIGIFVASGFDDSQVVKAAQMLRNRGARVMAIGMGQTHAVAVAGKQGSLLKPDAILSDLAAADLDAIIIPDGDSAKRIRGDERALTLILEMNQQKKPVGAIGNAVTVFASAGLVSGFRVTADPMIKLALIESGAKYVDQGVVVDHNLVTARRPSDLTHFIDAISFLLDPAPSLR